MRTLRTGAVGWAVPMLCVLAVTAALAGTAPRAPDTDLVGLRADGLPTPEEAQAAWNSLSEGDRLIARDVWRAIMQSDGNLVLVTPRRGGGRSAAATIG